MHKVFIIAIPYTYIVVQKIFAIDIKPIEFKLISCGYMLTYVLIRYHYIVNTPHRRNGLLYEIKKFICAAGYNISID